MYYSPSGNTCLSLRYEVVNRMMEALSSWFVMARGRGSIWDKYWNCSFSFSLLVRAAFLDLSFIVWLRWGKYLLFTLPPGCPRGEAGRNKLTQHTPVWKEWEEEKSYALRLIIVSSWVRQWLTRCAFNLVLASASPVAVSSHSLQSQSTVTLTTSALSSL